MKDIWNDRYQKDDFYYGKSPNDFLVNHVHRLPKAGRILCLAEGGRNAVYLAKLGFSVTAIDISSVGLSKLEKYASENGVTITTRCEDLETVSLDDQSWDGIVSIWCHLPSAILGHLYQKCCRALTPEGVLLIEAYRPDQLQRKTGGPSHPDWMPTLNQITTYTNTLTPYLAREIEREVHEGAGHNGISSVVQYIGKKESVL